ncbi:MAG TPA: FapA family protein [Spirochaetota bacterium]|nr:FapA family protein [Spirochaetota bacterium]
MIKHAEYIYNPKLEIDKLYQAVLDETATPETFSQLSQNFVNQGKAVIKFSNEYKLDTSENISYENSLHSYFTKEPGFIFYKDKQLVLYPLIFLNELKTACSVIVPQKNKTSEPLTKEIILAKMEEFGLQTAVSEEQLNEAIDCFENSNGKKITLCHSTAPINGISEIVDLVYESATTKVGTEDRWGNIDYKNKNFTNNVKKGEHIANYKPPVEGSPGRDLYGKEIPPQIETPDTYSIGEGLEIVEGSNAVLAAMDGVLHIAPSKTISVGLDEVIDKDLDINVGNLDVKGNVIIKGNILPGLTVKASGNVSIDGNVEEGTVEADGDLIVGGGILGSKDSTIKCGGGIFATYINNATITAGKKIEVAKAVMNSSIITNESISVLSGNKNDYKGKIVGGSLTAYSNISTAVCGSPSGVKTCLEVGVNAQREQQLKKLNEELQQNEKNLAKLKNALGSQYFKNPESYIKKVPKEKLPVIKKVITNAKKCLDLKHKINNDIARVRGSSSGTTKSSVSIYKRVYENTHLLISNHPLHIKNEMNAATSFIYEKTQNAVIPISLKEKKKKN